MGCTPPIRGEQDRYTFSGMPIYRDDAASLESHDRLRFRMSDLDSIDNRGIDAGRVEGQHGAILHSENPVGLAQSLQGTGDMVLQQDEFDQIPHSGMPSGQPCSAHFTYPASNTEGHGQNGQSAHEPARRSQTKRLWKAKLRAMQTSIVWRIGGLERRNCRTTKPLVRSMRWIGQCCTCQDEDYERSGEEPIRQGIRLVEV